MIMTDFSWLDEIEKRLNAATPGPWFLYEPENSMDVWKLIGPDTDSSLDQKFIAHSPEDIKRLLHAVRVMKEALEYYAKPSEFLGWTKEHPEFFALYESLKETFERAGQKARTALEQATKVGEK